MYRVRGDNAWMKSGVDGSDSDNNANGDTNTKRGGS